LLPWLRLRLLPHRSRLRSWLDARLLRLRACRGGSLLGALWRPGWLWLITDRLARRGSLCSWLCALSGRLLSPLRHHLLSRQVAGTDPLRWRRGGRLLWRSLPLCPLLLAQLFLLRTLGGQLLGLLIPGLWRGCRRRCRLLASGIILLLLL